MLQRIQKLIETLGLSSSKFADEIGVPRSSISHIVSGRNKPSLDFVLKILERYPDINTEWLIFGSGSIFKYDNESLDSGDIDNKADIDTDSKMTADKEKPDLFSDTEKSVTEESIEDFVENEKSSLKDEDSEKYITKDKKKSSEKPLDLSSDDIVKIIVFYNDNTFSEYKRR
ncbi:MAG: helix-turn-helix domain-containing protein [Bacteroidota bacterium]